MKRTFLLTILTVLIPVLLNAQIQDDRNRTGSAYSSLAFGEPVDLYTPNAAGLGLTGVSLYDNYSVNSANPALWGVGGYTQGALSFDMQRRRANDGVTSSTYNQVKAERFQLVLPIVRARFGLSAGFLPVTRSDFSIRQQSNITVGNETIDFERGITGGGGVNRAEIGFGLRVTDQLAVGYSANLYFASLERQHGYEFDDATFNPVRFTEEMNGHALGHRFGIYARTSSLLRSGDELAFGTSVTLPLSLTMDRGINDYRSVRGQVRFLDLLSENGVNRGQIDLPLEYNLGLTYNISRFVTLSTEYLGQQWGDAAYSFNPSQEQYLADRSRIAVGSIFHPYRRDTAEGFFSSFKYSAGVSYDTGHLNMAGERLETLMFHGGLGIMSGRTASSVDLGFKFGFRGSQDLNQIEETVWGLKLTLNLAEIMFVPPRFQ